MKQILVVALMLGLALPAVAQTSIKGVELSPADATRVDRQCDALRFRMGTSLVNNPSEEPAPGESVADPSSHWANGADGVDEALTRLNLSQLSIQDCRRAGFYDN
ncbi:hypothetical protein PRN20_17340 [Devosia sp. ZB163]|uniref:hypothetical protein n=1 Tax=Devosia sp. ZB163 TaxID=3025938 RepID=UPI0023623BE7|nr:hypothetical protein [Devosia sp. ZB163]MDC9825499.1 hypothetical protein [Devosia sp. ZB163]